MPLGGAIISNVQKAQQLAKLGIFVFPALVTPNPENPYKTNKRPAIPDAHPKGDPLNGKCKGECGRRGHGFYDATNDPGYVEDLFEKYPRAEVGVYMGASGLVAADFDVKRSPDGTIEVDGFDSFEKKWLELPDTHSFESVSKAGGKQYIYAAPEGVNLGPAGNYRDMLGVDRRGGGSYSVWQGDVPTSRDAFSPAPEWLLDPATVRDTERFEGSVKDWMESLEKGEPSLIVRAAMDRTRELFESAGNDFDHAAMVERQFEAIRLGSEGHSGVDQLLDLIEELFLSREGSHSRGEEEWNFEWAESLSSGIEKYGAALELRNELPTYSISLVPQGVPDRLVTGEPGDKATFRELLASLLENGADDLTATSVLWNSPRTSVLARDWGLIFVSERVKAARERPEPVRENPTLKTPLDVEIIGEEHTTSEFLTDRELEMVLENDTFLDSYIAASASKGFVNIDVAIPAAWTCLSMAFGTRAYVPIGATPLEMNLWFTIAAQSGTGKTSEGEFLQEVLRVLLHEDDSSYSMSANSSPEGMETDLLTRDGRPTLIYEDEASSFFMNLRSKDWMATLPDRFARWYNGWVKGSTKLNMKELRGKNARTSLSSFMMATPDRFLPLIDASMFASGFLARTNWVIGAPPIDPDAKNRITYSTTTEKRISPAAFELANDLASVAAQFDSTVPVVGDEKATKRVEKAIRAFYKKGEKHPRYDSIEPSVTRLKETILKCAALLALYRGETVFDTVDVLTAIYHAETWFKTLLTVANEIAESPYSRDLALIEDYIKHEGGSVSRAALLHQFKGLIVRSQNELNDRLNFLVESGRVNHVPVSGNNKEVMYVING